MITIKDVRAKFPQYADLSDDQLADALHRRYYADLSPDQFRAKIGMGQQDASPATGVSPPPDAPTVIPDLTEPAMPTFEDRIAATMQPPEPRQASAPPRRPPTLNAEPARVTMAPGPVAGVTDPLLAAMRGEAVPGSASNGLTPAMTRAVSSRDANDLRPPSDPFEGESFMDLARRRGQEVAQGAGEVFANNWEGLGAMTGRAMRTPQSQRGAADMAANYEATIGDIKSRLQDPSLDQNTRAFLEQNLADLTQGLDRLRPISAGQGMPPEMMKEFSDKAAGVRQTVSDTFGAAPSDTSFWSKMAQGAGSMWAFLATTLGGAAVGGPAVGVGMTAATGATSNAGQVYTEAKKSGADENTALDASGWAFLIGSTEAVTIGRALHYLPSGLRDRVSGWLLRRVGEIILDAGEEGAQEYLSQVANNILAQQYYDPERGWTDGAAESGIIGAILGGGVGAAGLALEGRPAGQDVTAPPRREEPPADPLDQITAAMQPPTPAPAALTVPRPEQAAPAADTKTKAKAALEAFARAAQGAAIPVGSSADSQFRALISAAERAGMTSDEIDAALSGKPQPAQPGPQAQQTQPPADPMAQIVAAMTGQTAPQNGQNGQTITRAEAEADPDRYEIVDEAEGQGANWRPTGAQVVIDKTTGRAIPLAPDTAAANPAANAATEIAPDGFKLVHGGKSGLTLDAIEIIRTGQKQAKNGKKLGGFYAASEADADYAESYAGMVDGGTTYDVVIKPGTKILRKDGDITRLSEKQIADWLSQGIGIVVGKDPRGKTEYAVIDKNAIQSLDLRRLPSPPSSSGTIQTNDQGNQATGQAPEADVVAASGGTTPPAPMPNAAPRQKGQPEDVVFLDGADVQQVQTDAATFQYKDGGDSDGVTDRLRGVTKWDTARAGMAIIYERADGTRVIADGHQRLGLAKRLAAEGQPVRMPAIVMREVDGVSPQEARAAAAFKNIAEGSGTATDAAKVLRDTDTPAAELGLPPNSALVRDALGLRNLSDDAFGMVVNGVATEAAGGLVGRIVQNKELHRDILGLLARLKPANAFQAEAIVRQAMDATTTETQTSLFGDEEVQANLYLERAKILDGALKRVRDDLKTFKTLVTRAEKASAAGNVLNATANQSRLDADTALRDYLGAQANMKGPISDALTEAARAYRADKRISPAIDAFLANLERAMAPGGGDGQTRNPSGQTDSGKGGGTSQAVSPTSGILAAMGAKPTPETEATPAGQQAVGGKGGEVDPPQGDKRDENAADSDLFGGPAPDPQAQILAAMTGRKPKGPEAPGADPAPAALPPADPFAPAQTGKTPAQIKAEAEAAVRAQQSKLRTAKPQDDAGPLFGGDQTDLFADKPTAEPKPDFSRRSADLRRSLGGSGQQTIPGSKTRDMTETDLGRDLEKMLAKGDGLTANEAIADAFVLENGKKTGREHLVVLGPNGELIALLVGTKSGVDFSDVVMRAISEGKIGYTIHNHPSNRGYSSRDIYALFLGADPVAVVGHDGARHIARRGAATGRIKADDAEAVYADMERWLTKAWNLLIQRDGAPQSRVDILNAQFHNVLTLAMARAGLIEYDGTAGADLAKHGVDFDGILPDLFAAMAPRLGRAGYSLPTIGDRGSDSGTRADGSGAGTGRGTEADAGVSRDGDGARRDRGETGDLIAMGPPPARGPAKTGNDALDSALDDIFGDEGDVSGTGNDLERGGRGGPAADGMGATDVSAGSGKPGRSPGGGNAADQAGDGQRSASGRLPSGDASSVGAGGNPGADGTDGTDRQPATSGGRGGRGGGGGRRLPADTGRGADPAGNAPGATPGKLTPAQQLAAIRGILKEDLFDFVTAKLGSSPYMLREDAADPIDPRKAEALRSIFVGALEGVNVRQATDRDLFRSIIMPLRDAGMTRDEVAQLSPYLTAFLANLRAGRVGLTPEPAPRAIEADDRTAVQAKADRIKPVAADEANIRATLPLLLPAQQDDVLKVERRFAKPDGHGMMITNGTGTGKTFSGGGVIKRFVQMGKGNILIVAPSEAVIAGWTKALAALDVPVNQLRDTKDAGQAVTITTYANLRDNDALASRSFDLVVTDESQNLMSSKDGAVTGALQNLRAITHRPADLWRKSRMRHATEWEAYKAMRDSEAKTAVYRRLKSREEAEVARWTQEPRSKVLFLSATPFAYDKAVDYAEGYLFDYPKDGHVGRSRQSGQNLFMVQHFGYRIRYHKLTKPEAAVDSAVFEREFHEKLKRDGVLSGRSLQVDVDYDRKFVLAADGLGTQIDAVLKHVFEGRRNADKAIADGYQTLEREISQKFNYLKRMQLLEAIKARAAIPDIEKHLALGRKVVVFHDYNVGGGFNPFSNIAPANDANAIAAAADLMAAFPDLNRMKFASYAAPVDALLSALGKRARAFNGTVPQKKRLQNLADFNTDGSGADVLVVQSDAGGAGISMHDLTGTHQRVLINLGMPTKPTTTLQEEGRILRVGTVTNAPFRYYTIGTAWERRAFATRIAEHSGTVENLALGNEARDLLTGFIEAYEAAEALEPGPDDGKGGKERDRKANVTSPFEKAKTHYFGRTKTTGRRDQRDGIDFYPTPEPLALKMVEWAGIRPNERVLEPSAGDGAIARYVPDFADLTMVEPSSDLSSRALLKAPHGKTVESTFETYHLVNKAHVIVMNPPFGSGGATAMQHLAKAAKHLRAGGRIVALIPTGPSADKRFDAWWEGDDAKGLSLSAEVALPAVAFERAGTNVMTRVVIIDKPADGQEVAPDTQRLNFTGARSINEFFDRLEQYDVRRRPDPVQDVVEEMEAEGQDATAPMPQPVQGPPLAAKADAFKLAQVKHAKTGADLFVATIRDKVEREEYTAILAVAKQHGGYYSSFRGNGAVPGFQFKSEADRQAFLDDMVKPTAGFAETAYHGTPHDFDRFSLDAIGTGEGAQVFGWGLYFAGRREVSEWYREKLSRGQKTLEVKIKGKTFWGWAWIKQSNIDEDWFDTWIGEQIASGNAGAAVEAAERLAERAKTLGLKVKEAAAKKIADMVRNGEVTAIRHKPGRLFTVDIPGPENLLDWDAQLADQPEAVTQAMRGILPDLFGGKGESIWTEETETAVTHRAWRDQFGWQIIDLSKVYAGGYFSVVSPRGTSIAEKRKMSDAKDAAVSARKHFAESMTGRQAYTILSAERGGDRAASEALRAAGIPGHRYLDGSSRNAGEGSHNYVIYDDAAITILEKQQRAQMVREAAASTEEIIRLMPRLRAELDRLGLKRVRLVADSAARDWQGMFHVTGDGALEIVIGASMNPMGTLHHEVIHALRAMNLFTPEEWRALELAAVRWWIAKHNIAARYPDLLPHEQIEEAIAEEFSEALAARKSPKGSALVTAFNKIARLFRAIRNALQGAGFQTAEDIFGRILAGEIGKRQAGNAGVRASAWAQAAAPDTEAFEATLKHDLGLRSLSLFVTGNGDLKLNMLAVERNEQGQGIGTKAMSRITEFADQNGFRLILSPGLRDDGFGTTSRDRLVRFYKRFGFVENKGRRKDFGISEGMFRDPVRNRFQRPKAVRPISAQARAHRSTAMGGALFIPDRGMWRELTRAGAPIWSRLGGAAGGLSDGIDRARILIQDRFLPVLRAQEVIQRATGKALPPEANAYITETTFSGKVGRHLFEIDEDFTKPIVHLIAKTKGALSVEAVGQWLYARHALERNARIADINPAMPDGGSGMSNAEAQQILDEAAAGPHAAVLTEIGGLIDALRERTLVLREDAGLITHDEAAMWRKMYRHYVPLKGFTETDHSEAVLDVSGIGKRFNVRGQESRRALGRESEAFNPLQAAFTQAQEVAIRAEKNRVGQSLFELAKDYPSKALWEVKKPVQKRYFNRSTGLVETRVEDPVSIILEPNEMAVKISGEEHRILFHDERLARAAGTVGADQMGQITRLLSMFSRFWSMTRTMLNPEFAVTNAFRDFQTAQYNIQAFGEGDKGAIAKAMIRDWRKALAGSWRAQGNRYDTEWAKHYREFQKAGAQVSFWTIEQPEVAKADLERRVALSSGTVAARALKRLTSPRALLSMRDNPVLAMVERANIAVDNAIRLAAFVEARKRGWSVHDAAFLAKELTVNFNRRGEWSGNLNALYPFFNAAVQGGVRTAKALTSRRVMYAALASFAAGALNDLLNAWLSEEDDDGQLFYDKVPEYRNERNFHIVGWGTGQNPAAVPMPYGYNIFPYAGQNLGKVLRGVKTPGEAMGDVAAALFAAFSPISGGSETTMVSPFFADPFIEMAENKDWTGSPIYPRYPEIGVPDSGVAFAGASEAAKKIAALINAATGGDFREDGLISISPETLDHLSVFVTGSAGAFVGRTTDVLAKAFTGKFSEIEMRHIPFLRNTVSQVGPWVDRDLYYKHKAAIQDANADVKAYAAAGHAIDPRKQAVADLYDDLLKAEREMDGRGEFNQSKAGATPRRSPEKVMKELNRKYLAIFGKVKP